MQRKAERLYRMYEHDPDAKYLVCFASSYLPQRETFPPEAFGVPRRVPFEGLLVPIPQDADRVLRTIYGDYLRFPPPPKRKPPHPPFVVKEPSDAS
jgi:lipopolysaccharide cholinephosphotransferase